MNRLDESVRVYPDKPFYAINRRVGRSTRRADMDVHETSEETRGLNEFHECTRRVGTILTVDSSLTSVNFRVLSNMRNGDHGGVKWYFSHSNN